MVRARPSTCEWPGSCAVPMPRSRRREFTMPASAATLARCLDLRHRAAAATMAHDAAAWATRAHAQQIIRENPRTSGMIPMRAFNAFFVFWVAAMTVHVSDVRLVLRYLRTDHRSIAIACLDRPEGLTTLAPSVPTL